MGENKTLKERKLVVPVEKAIDAALVGAISVLGRYKDEKEAGIKKQYREIVLKRIKELDELGAVREVETALDSLLQCEFQEYKLKDISQMAVFYETIGAARTYHCGPLADKYVKEMAKAKGGA